MKINKKQLLAITDLKLSEDKMNNAQFEEYCKHLDAFIEILSAQETNLKIFFEAKDYTSFCQILLTLKDALIKIRANDLAKNCVKLLNDVKTTKHGVVEAYLTYFLAAVSALSIDIQMAQYKETAPKETDTENKAAGTNGERKENTHHTVPIVQPLQKSILAVDDVSLILNGLKTIMQDTPYKFTGVTTGQAALKFIQEHRPNLFILDIEMPTMNGYDLAEKIRERGHTAPIVFLTGNSSREYVLKAVKAGAADFIVKPISREQVLDKIEKYIN